MENNKSKPKMHLRLKVFGEDVVIDYENEDVIFANRPEKSEKLNFNRVAAISSYLKEEGFLQALPDQELRLPD